MLIYSPFYLNFPHKLLSEFNDLPAVLWFDLVFKYEHDEIVLSDNILTL